MVEMRVNDDQTTLEGIIEGCKKGDNIAYSALIDRYSKRFYNYFHSQTYNRQVSDDLLSEFYLKLVKNIKSYKDGSFEAWMYKVATNVYYDYIRKYLREKENNIKYCEEKSYLDDCRADKSGGISEMDGMDVHAALSQLDDDSRNLIAMRFFSDMSFKEIAEVSGRPIGTVLAKIHRGIIRLKQIMDVEK